MVSKSTFSSTSTGETKVGDLSSLTYKITQLKNQIQEERRDLIKEKIMKNKRKQESDSKLHMSLATSRTKDSSTQNSSLSGTMLSSRIENPLGLVPSLTSTPDVAIHATKLPFIDKLPSYITWTFLTRNVTMTEDQSFIGKPYMQDNENDGDAIIDNVEETAEPVEEPHEFSVAEKNIIRMVSQDYEPSEEVLELLTDFIGGTTSEISEVFNVLKEKEEENLNENVSINSVENTISVFLENSLTTALDSIDSLFCRRCLVFDCSLHGNSQPLTGTPSDRQKYAAESQENERPCSDECYLLLQAAATCPDRATLSNVDARTANMCLDEDSPIDGSPDTLEENSNKEAIWKPLEKDLYLKGLDMFGRNSCLITRNLLPGLKTCTQVYTYMCDNGTNKPASSDNNGKTGVNHKKLLCQKVKAKKLKYSLKSTGHQPLWRRIANGKSHLNKKYTPCECDSLCGKDCPCIKNSTCCEKYCGCSRSCKNRFRGCHCAKSQCRSQQCPCYSARRECDPDVCRNCWVSCGDGSLGEPSRRGESQCGNMRILLRQQKRILLGRSDITGWGAFLQDSVCKDEYLGEYTGELISQQEADVRGKEYDRIGTSFLFNLNDEYVIDAMRKGDKLKFANHSLKPNCYAKIIKVGGDHRVGIFAKEKIEAGTELFYDYCYEPNHTPSWAIKGGKSKRDASIPHGRAKKNQSH